MSDADGRKNAAEPMIGCHGLSVGYNARLVLEGISLEVAAGTWTAVVGPNGCGKSTLLRALAGLLAPATGSVFLRGRRLQEWPRRERAKRLAWLAQASTPADLTVDECVSLGRFAHIGWLGHHEAADRIAVERAMRATGTLELAHRRLPTLSGGERQRVHLARVLAVEASVLLLDEPTTHLDPPHQEDIGRIMRDQSHGCGVTIVSAIHDLSLALMADQVVVMGPQGVVGHGTVERVLEQDWLSRAFGEPIHIVRHADTYLWQPRLGTRPGR
jgi:iron complex transport system ATP-binding protein